MSPKRRLAVAVAAVIAAVVTAVGWQYGEDLSSARQRITGRSELAQTACGPIEYAVIGAGEPVLFVHGAGGGFDQGLGIAHELSRHGLKVVLMSRFGYLRTPMPADASAAAQADAHACLLDALKIDRAVVAGVSAGAPSTVQFALRHPQRTRALVLLVPAGRAPGNAATAPAATEFIFDTALRSDLLFWAATRFARDTMIASVLATPPAQVHAASEAEQRRVDELLDQILPVSARRLGLLNDARIVSALAPVALEGIGTPALVISVQDDGFGTWDIARQMASQLPNARFVGYDRGGHVWVGHHDEVLQEMVAFATGVPNPRTAMPDFIRAAGPIAQRPVR